MTGSTDDWNGGAGGRALDDGVEVGGAAEVAVVLGALVLAGAWAAVDDVVRSVVDEPASISD